MKFAIALMMLFGSGPGISHADPLEIGMKAIGSQAGCYLVDYDYTETESLKPDYIRDSRVYDVNKDKAVKEWIYAETISPTRIRLQHILFAVNLDGTLMEGSFLKHQAEDWEFNSAFLYDFAKPFVWNVKTLAPNLWTRRITNLDDGLRYQCAAVWSEKNFYPEWSCENYAPIPGRETRDMGRKDYNTLDRFTRIVAYGKNWLERQENTKVIDQNGTRTPLAKELGKTWYTRLPDEECAGAKSFVEEGSAFWTILRETWDEVLDGSSSVSEKAGSARYGAMIQLEESVKNLDLKDPTVRKTIKAKIKTIIGAYQS